MRSVLKLFIFAGLFSALMTGCYPNEDLSYSDLDVAATIRDDKFNFNDNMVCVLIADVKWAVNDTSAIREQEIPNEDYIIAEVLRNLKDNTKFDVYSVNDTTELRAKINAGTIPMPELFVTLSVMQNEYTYYYPYYGYWYGYWYWKSASLKSAENTNYYYYPYYPYYGTSVSYTFGTVFMDMLDASKLMDEVTENEKLPMVWNGIINGIESGSMSDHKSRITREVNQCFNQSPYLR